MGYKTIRDRIEDMAKDNHKDFVKAVISMEKGIKSLRSNSMGDLYCHVLVETPVNLTDRQKELLEEFEKISTGLDRSQTPRKKSFWDKVGDLFD